MRIGLTAACAFALAIGACSAPEQAPAAKLTIDDAKSLWNQIVYNGRLCDIASKGVAEAAETGDRYKLYPALRDGIEACKRASIDIMGLEPPEAATGEIKNAFDESIDTCSMAHVQKQMAFEAMAKVVDGDMSPSAVTHAKERSEASQMGMLQCGATFMKATGMAGFDIQKVFGDDPENADADATKPS